MSGVDSNRYFKLFFTAISFIVGYEWIVSGLDKILSGDFVSGLHQQMQQAISNIQYPFYGAVLQKMCMPHCVIWAVLVETGELVLGLSFFIVAIMLVLGKANPTVLTIGFVSSMIGAFINLNFYFYQGGYFTVQTSDPFDEGIPIDLILACIQVVYGIVMYSQITSAKRSNDKTISSVSSEAEVL